MNDAATRLYFDSPEFDRRATVDDRGLPTAWFGHQDSVPWPTPPLAEAVYLSFYGRGGARTPVFRHSAEASLRLILEAGAGRLTLEGEAGQALTEALELTGQATLLPLPGPAISGLLIETEGSWALTVAWIPEPQATSGAGADDRS